MKTHPHPPAHCLWRRRCHTRSTGFQPVGLSRGTGCQPVKSPRPHSSPPPTRLSTLPALPPRDFSPRDFFDPRFRNGRRMEQLPNLHIEQHRQPLNRGKRKPIESGRLKGLVMLVAEPPHFRGGLLCQLPRKAQAPDVFGKNFQGIVGCLHPASIGSNPCHSHPTHRRTIFMGC